MRKNPMLLILTCSLGIAVLILDSKTALLAMQSGIQMCLQTTIPALFPMMVLTTLLTSGLIGKKLPLMAPVCKICGIPRGGESLLVTGLIGGYPVGAKCVAQAYRSGSLSRQEARRLLGFCSNAGPAFIFGIAGLMFSDVSVAWWLWGIHIVSSLLVGALLPGKRCRSIRLHDGAGVSLSTALSDCVKTMGSICGWTVWICVVSTFMKRWFLWLLPSFLQAAVLGALELVNGCHSLLLLNQEGARFVLCSMMLSFGGLCVFLQTLTVTRPTGTGMYFPGKVLQSLLSGLIAFGMQFLLFEPIQQQRDPSLLAMVACFVTVILLPYIRKWKKSVAFFGKVVYNG